jgi:glycosyltransferase involved in cell wall biosynthesis
LKLSVIIPVYNSRETIEKCIFSVLDQTYSGEIEIIAVNDGSTDESLLLLNKIKSNIKDPRFSFIIIDQKNGGVSKARNAGLKKATGELIAFLDSDDEWFENKTLIQMHYFADEKCNWDFVACCRNNEKISFPYKIISGKFAIITLRKLLFKVVGQTSTAIFRRKILENTGYFDENQKYSEDANYWMRISLKNKMIILKDDLVLTGGGKPAAGFSGLSANLIEMEKGVQKNIDEIYKSKNLNFFEYSFFKLFSKIKYYKRIITVKKNNG